MVDPRKPYDPSEEALAALSAIAVGALALSAVVWICVRLVAFLVTGGGQQ